MARLSFGLQACTALGCGPAEPELSTRTIRVYSLPACPAPEAAELEFEALGPFAASNRSAEVLPLDARRRVLPFPEETRAIAAVAEENGRRFIGYGSAATGDLELVLWPEGKACSVFRDAAAAGFPSRGGGQALGYSPRLGLLLAAGGNDAKSSAVVGALTFDVRTGQAYAVDAAQRHVLGEPRAFATVTEFGDKLLVAGGEDPIHDVAEERRVLRFSGEVYDPTTRRFELELVTLRYPRTRHAALTLPSGESLLVGGRSDFGSALATLEAVSPATRSSSVGGLQPLAFGRIEPAALRLTDGRIFVGGGYDESGAPVRAFEWLAPDASRSVRVDDNTPVPPRFDRAFIALPGGSVLAVGGCEDRPPSSAIEAARCASVCRRGCPSSDGDAWWIAADASATRVTLSAPAPRPLLAAGSDGSPWLFVAHRTSAGELDPGRSDAYRFDPFSAVFEPWPAPDPSPPTLFTAAVSVAPDHFFWFGAEEPPILYGLRGGTRERFARDVALVATSDPLDPLRPWHLAPDRSAEGTLSYDGRVHFEAAAPPTLWVTDTLYDDVELVLVVDGAPPVVMLAGTALGATDCPWPEGEGGREELRVVRAGERIELRRGQLGTSCEVPAGAAAIGLRAGTEATTVVTLAIERL